MSCAASPPEIRILIVEDMEHEAELIIHRLRRSGCPCEARRVQTETQLRDTLAEFTPSVILSDFTLPEFDAFEAMRICRALVPDVPFILVSGTLGEEHAIAILHRGATDYVSKNNLARLPAVIRRAVHDTATRLEQQRRIARMDRILRMVSGVNSAMVRIREPAELLRETCRLSVSIGGYAAAVACMQPATGSGAQPVASYGTSAQLTEALCTLCERSRSRDSSVIGQVMRSGKPAVFGHHGDSEETGSFDRLMVSAGLMSLVAMPLLVDGTPVGVLVLTASEPEIVSEEELAMLREVSGNLSFALQYLQTDTTLQRLSHFDPQTGLARRALFCERTARLFADAGEPHPRFLVAVFDIERLSLINDSFGRRTGDLLLQHVAERLREKFAHKRSIAHFGGGTFAVALELDVSGQQVADLLTACREHTAILAETFLIEGREIPVAVRSGFAIYPQDATDADTLVQRAETALHEARASGEREQHYSAVGHSKHLGRLTLEHKLRGALARDQFELHYQPKVSVTSRRIEGLEALLRWRDPDAGLIAPAHFLPLLESTGLIVEIGRWVIQRAAHDCRQWLLAGLPPVRVAVNVSPLQLRQQNFVETFRDAQPPWPSALCGIDIEITEGMLQEDRRSEIRKLTVLRRSGVRIAIDDFGTGYSSLRRLASLPVDTLKIDRCFIDHVPGDRMGNTVVKTIIALARVFGMTTVAEGVEYPQQLEFLARFGCDQSQGYLHSRPVPCEQIMTLLADGGGSMLQAPQAADALTLAPGSRAPLPAPADSMM